MKKLAVFCLVLAALSIQAFSQRKLSSVSEMKWGLDNEMFLKLSDDSTYTMDVRQLFHVPQTKITDFSSEFVYYPVDFDQNYIDNLNQKKDSTLTPGYKTLWSAVHNDIGGGWVHFANCLLFSLESGALKLDAELMKRPKTKWKPNPMTDTYKRTRKWDYYVPFTQREARKEYKLRAEENKLGDVKNLPTSFVSVFLNTSQRQYKKMHKEGRRHLIAKIDLVKLMLGTNYLSETQLSYIRNSVFTAIKKYTSNRLPSVIIFDEYNAAAMMKLNVDGYYIEKIVFNPKYKLRTEEIQQSTEEINKIISKINEYNKQSFQKRLDSYYN